MITQKLRLGGFGWGGAAWNVKACLVCGGKSFFQDANDGGAVRGVGASRREAARGKGRSVGERPATHGPKPVLRTRARQW